MKRVIIKRDGDFMSKVSTMNVFKGIIASFSALTLLMAGLVFVNIQKAHSVSEGTEIRSRLALGRGYDLVEYGKDWSWRGVKEHDIFIDNKTDGGSPCILASKLGVSATNHHTDIDVSASEWSRKYGVGLSGSYDNSITVGKGEGENGKKKVEYMDGAGTLATIDGKAAILPEWAAKKVSDAAGGAAASVSYGASEGWKYNKTSIKIQDRIVAYQENLTFLDGAPSDDGTKCSSVDYDGTKITSQTDLEKARLNVSEGFRRDYEAKMGAKQFLDKWGSFVLTKADFGATAEISYLQTKDEQSKSQNVAASAEGHYSGVSGKGDMDWQQASAYIKAHTTVTANSVGPSTPFNGSVPQGDTLGNYSNWVSSIINYTESGIPFVGPVDLDASNQLPLSQMGYYVWELIDPRILAPKGNTYPSVEECDNYYGDLKGDDSVSISSDEFAEGLAICKEKAGTQMTYADYLISEFNTEIWNNMNSIMGKYFEAPYVKDIFIAYSAMGSSNFCKGGGCTNQKESAKEALNKLMENSCRNVNPAAKTGVSGCVKLNHDDLNLNSGAVNAQAGVGYQARAIYMGYTLTNNINEALVSFDVVHDEGVDDDEVGDAGCITSGCQKTADITPCGDYVMGSDTNHQQPGVAGGEYPINRPSSNKNYFVCTNGNVAKNMNAGVGNGWYHRYYVNPNKKADRIFIKNARRYNPQLGTTVPSGNVWDPSAVIQYNNAPITAIGMSRADGNNKDNKSYWPQDGGHLPTTTESTMDKHEFEGSNLLQGRMLDPDSFLTWFDTGVSTNEGAYGTSGNRPKQMHIWYRH